MSQNSDLPEVISVIPLPGALLLPRSRLPMHVFEPRYLALIDDVLKTSQRLVGIIQPSGTEPGSEDELFGVGCAGRLTGLSETEDGRYMITLSGKSRFRVKQEVEGFAPYRRCEVNWDGFERDFGPVETDDDFDRADFLEILQQYFVSQGLETDWQGLAEAEDELLVNSLAMLCPFESEDKQALLEAPTLRSRHQTMSTLMKFALRGGNDDVILQ
eukprot:TRINITY_DN67924_c0_g1_i1.p2 TRINITY_DN67924_c0_g1~~TRINITY_DN67924_c0_g1_i1.p2  ORF type:complete len:215 (-),score=63.86 TRINITY_DN67924_c0_g1_i1:32-676(-)